MGKSISTRYLPAHFLLPTKYKRDGALLLLLLKHAFNRQVPTAAQIEIQDLQTIAWQAE